MPIPSHPSDDSRARRQRRRRTHQREDSSAELLGPNDEHSHHRSVERRHRRQYESEDESSRHRRRRYESEDDGGRRRDESQGTPSKTKHRRRSEYAELSSDRLAQLDSLNRAQGWDSHDQPSRRTRRPDADRERRTSARHADEGRRTSARYAEDDHEREAMREERRQRRRDDRRSAALAAAGGAAVEAPTDALRSRKSRDDRTHAEARHRRRDSSRRIASGAQLERGNDYPDDVRYQEKKALWTQQQSSDGTGNGSGGGSSIDDSVDPEQRKKKLRKWIIIGVAILVLVLIIVIPVAVVVSKKSHDSGQSGNDSGSGSSSSGPNNSNLGSISESDIPAQYQGTYLDPFTWYDTQDFNVTFTSQMVGNLSIMGLNSTWDDSTRANENVPALNEVWDYGQGKQMVHGINLGGWLSIEPFITPSLFDQFSAHDNVVDEYTLTSKLGPSLAASTIEKHYSSFITEQDFADIQAAGFDHIRIPYSYWAITTYEGDPYVEHTSWRYLLRGIEWARKYGLRINLDLHGAPGSQNGWNHSGRQGLIRWLNGTDGTLNGDRTTDIHNSVSTFFAQPRYKNIIAMYGLVNEPRMVELDRTTVLDWSRAAINTIRGNNYTGVIVMGDGFMGLENWQGLMQGIPDLLLDVHQYVIFNTGQLVLNHHDKINFACGGWTSQALQSSNPATGFGPTLCGEWSQADTDCATYLNNVGVGSRWEGTLNMADGLGGSTVGDVLTPTCPTKNDPRCDCQPTTADPSSYSAEYKQWLLMFAEAQMHSFEQGWGWFYWTWRTESAAQWSYRDGLAAGIMPAVAYQRNFTCSQDIPDFASLGLPENY